MKNYTELDQLKENVKETIYQQTIKHILILEKTKGEDEVSNGIYHQSIYIISLFIDLKNIHFDYQSEKGNNLIDTCTKQTFLREYHPCKNPLYKDK